MYQVLLNGVIVTTTSASLNIENMGEIAIQVTCANHAAGNGVFSVLGSNDGVNYKALAVQDNSAAPTTWITTKTLSGNGTDFVWLITPVKMIQILCTVTTDGTYTATIFSNKLTGR